MKKATSLVAMLLAAYTPSVFPNAQDVKNAPPSSQLQPNILEQIVGQLIEEIKKMNNFYTVRSERSGEELRRYFAEGYNKDFDVNVRFEYFELDGQAYFRTTLSATASTQDPLGIFKSGHITILESTLKGINGIPGNVVHGNPETVMQSFALNPLVHSHIQDRLYPGVVAGTELKAK